MTVTISGKPYEVPQEVADQMQLLYDEREANYNSAATYKAKYDELRDAVLNMRTKEYTAERMRTKAFRLLAWEAKKALYGLVGVKVEQLTITDKAA